MKPCSTPWHQMTSYTEFCFHAGHMIYLVECKLSFFCSVGFGCTYTKRGSTIRPTRMWKNTSRQGSSYRSESAISSNGGLRIRGDDWRYILRHAHNCYMSNGLAIRALIDTHTLSASKLLHGLCVCAPYGLLFLFAYCATSSTSDGSCI